MFDDMILIERLVALDIMEVNPTLGGDVEKEKTIYIGCSLARFLFTFLSNPRAALGETLL